MNVCIYVYMYIHTHTHTHTHTHDAAQDAREDASGGQEQELAG